MLAPLALFSMLSTVALVAADDIMTTANLTTQILYQPYANWFMTRNGHCGSIDRYTQTIGSNATFYFSGTRLSVSIGRRSDGGVVRAQIDDLIPLTVDLWSQNPVCGTLFDYGLQPGEHVLVLSLINQRNNATGGIAPPSLHLNNITFWTPRASSTPAATSVPAQHAHHTNVGAIVAGVVSGVVGLILVAAAIFFLMRRQKRNARHSFNPTKFWATELSPRTAAAAPADAVADADVKMQPYARMSDELDAGRDRKAQLEVPPPSYAISLNGLRARSPSPDPDRKAAV